MRLQTTILVFPVSRYTFFIQLLIFFERQYSFPKHLKIYILGKPGLNQNSASKHCDIYMCKLSLMTSNIFLRRSFSTTVLTAFTTLDGKESPMQRTVQVTKKSVGKIKAGFHTSYLKLWSLTCRILCRTQNWWLLLWLDGWEIQIVWGSSFFFYSLFSLLPWCQRRVADGIQGFILEVNILWDIRLFHLGQFRVHLYLSKQDFSTCQGVLKDKAVST